MIFRRDRFVRGGDHTSFNQEGFAAVRFTEWRENFNHQHQTSRVENGIEYGDLTSSSSTSTTSPTSPASTPPRSPRSPPHPASRKTSPSSTRPTTPRTVLRWEKPAGFPAGATFEVVYRDTIQPDWTTFVSAGTATTITLAISKDNVIFGVRSVDAAGHRSAAVYPVPPPRQPRTTHPPRLQVISRFGAASLSTRRFPTCKKLQSACRPAICDSVVPPMMK